MTVVVHRVFAFAGSDDNFYSAFFFAAAGLAGSLMLAARFPWVGEILIGTLS